MKVLFSLPARRTGTALIVAAAVSAAAAFTAGAAGAQTAGGTGPSSPGPRQTFNPGSGLGVPNLVALAAGFGQP